MKCEYCGSYKILGNCPKCGAPQGDGGDYKSATEHYAKYDKVNISTEPEKGNKEKENWHDDYGLSREDRKSANKVFAGIVACVVILIITFYFGYLSESKANVIIVDNTSTYIMGEHEIQWCLPDGTAPEGETWCKQLEVR
jgi:uncharacterized membrane protein YvbJ